MLVLVGIMGRKAWVCPSGDGLFTAGKPAWDERFRDGYFELYGTDKEGMRRVWRMTRKWLRAAPLVEDD